MNVIDNKWCLHETMIFIQNIYVWIVYGICIIHITCLCFKLPTIGIWCASLVIINKRSCGSPSPSSPKWEVCLWWIHIYFYKPLWPSSKEVPSSFGVILYYAKRGIFWRHQLGFSTRFWLSLSHGFGPRIRFSSRPLVMSLIRSLGGVGQHMCPLQQKWGFVMISHGICYWIMEFGVLLSI